MQGSFFQNRRSKLMPYCFFLILSLPQAVPNISSYPRVKQSNVQNKTPPSSFQTGASTRLHNNLVQCTSLLYTTPLILICRGRRLTCENWGPAKQTKHLLIFVLFKISSSWSFCGNSTTLRANELGLIWLFIGSP